jgi:hypothetical protein
LIFVAAWWQRDSAGSEMHGRQESTDIGIADGLSPTRSRVRWSGGYIVAWPAADGRYPVGDDSQQELADAVGSVREVVARVLQDFRIDRLVATSPDSIHSLGLAGLHEQSWNPAAV